jgi:hypothetical protein
MSQLPRFSAVSVLDTQAAPPVGPLAVDALPVKSDGFGSGYSGTQGSLLGDVFETSMIGAGLNRAIDRAAVLNDENFQWTPETFNAFITSYDIPREAYADIAQARSYNHARIIRDQALELQNAYRRLSTLGVAGDTLRIGASLADPYNVLLLAIPEAAPARFAGLLTKAGRLETIVANGLVQGVANTAAEAIRVETDPFASRGELANTFLTSAVVGGLTPGLRDYSRLNRLKIVGGSAAGAGFIGSSLFMDGSFRDSLVAGSLAGILGGGFAAIPKAEPLLARTIHQAQAADLIESGLPLTAKGQAFVDDAITPRPTVSGIEAFLADAVALAEDVPPGPRLIASLFDDQEVNLGVDVFSILQASRRQMKQTDTPGFRAVSDKQFDARLTDEGVIEVGDRFFSLTRAERRAALDDALKFGLLDGEAAKLNIDDVRARVSRYGTTAPEVLWQLYPQLKADAAEGIAKRLGAIDKFEATRKGIPPLKDTSGVNVSISLMDDYLPKIRKAMDSLAKEGKAVTLKAIRKVASRDDFRFDKLVTDYSLMAAIRKIEISQGKDVMPIIGQTDRNATFKMGPDAAPVQQFAGGQFQNRAGEAAPATNPSTVSNSSAPRDNPIVSTQSRATNEPPADFVDAMNEVQVKPDVPTQYGDFDARPFDDTRSLWSGGKLSYLIRPFSMAAHFGRSNNKTIRRLGNMLVEDALPKENGRYQPGMTAERWIGQRHVATTAAYARENSDAFASWFKKQREAGQYSMLDSLAAESDFQDAVTKAVRRPGDKFDPEIERMANVFRKQMKDLYELANRHNVEGFMEFDPNDAYATRVYSLAKIDAAINDFGLPAVNELFIRSIKSKLPNIEHDMAVQIGEGMLSRIRSAKVGLEALEGARIMPQDMGGIVAMTMRDLGYSEGDINKVLRASDRINKQSGFERSMKRMQLDETLSMRANRKDGTTAELSFEDLLENNAAMLADTYSRQIHGRAAETRILQQFGNADVEAPTTWAGLRQRLEKEIRDDMDASRLNSDEAKRMIADLDRIEGVWKIVLLGGDISKTSEGVNFALQTIRQVNISTLMGQAGLGNLADFGAIVVPQNWKALTQQMPAIMELFKSGRDGKHGNDLLREIEAISGAGTERIRSHSPNRSVDTVMGRDFIQSKTSKVLHKVTNGLADLSGMSLVQTTTQRIASTISAQKFVNMALAGEKLSDAHLASMSIDRPMLKRISEQVRKHTTLENGSNLRRLNLSEWTDIEAAAAFNTAFDRYSRRVALQPDLGTMSLWMTSQTGKTLIQLRTFMVQAYEKLFLYPIATGNMEAFASWVTGMIIGGAAHVAKTYLNAGPGPQGDEYLAERLTPDQIAKAAFARSGFSSIFPTLVDTLALTTGKPVFSNTRMTGLANDPIWGNPTFDLMNRTWQSARAAVAPPLRSDYDFSQQDFRALRRFMPFQNAIPFNQILNAFQNELPKTSVTAP